jgi:hypothetical protein
MRRLVTQLALVVLALALTLLSLGAQAAAQVGTEGCAAVALASADIEAAAFESLARSITPPESVHGVPQEVTLLTAALDRAVAAYERVVQCHTVEKTARAYLREAQLIELHGQTIARLQLGPAASRTVARSRCNAIVRYVLVVRSDRMCGRCTGTDGRDARAQLETYLPNEITYCVDEQRTRDPGFTVFHMSELDTGPGR